MAAIECPYYEDWRSNPQDHPILQLAAFIGHVESAHGDQIPQPVRDSLKGCKKELEELPLADIQV